MKKLLLVLASPFLALFIAIICLAFGQIAEASWRHHGQHPVQSPPVITPPQNSQLQIGFFQFPGGTWTQKYTDGVYPSGSGNLEIFMEPPMNDTAILAGKFDAQLRSFAQSAAAHQGQTIVAFGEEVNCSTDPWGGTNNTVQQTKDAFNHEAQIVKSLAPNVKVMFSVNNDSCYDEGAPTIFYPGNNYVDLIGVDGFDFGGQTWDQVFDHAIQPLQVLGKPLWIGSEGSVDNQPKFISDSLAGAAKYNLQGIIYYNADQFTAPASTLQSL